MRGPRPPVAERVVVADGWRVRLDVSSQVLRLEAEPADDRNPLSPVPPASGGGPVSAAALLLKAKQVEDGVLAAVELAAQNGAGRFPGKAGLLRALAGGDGPGAALIRTACHLGGVTLPGPATIDADAHGRFLRDEGLSKPVGFYTWTPELTALFRQDRFLQQPLDPAVADELHAALARDPDAAAAHAAYLRLAARLTNPPMPLTRHDGAKVPGLFPWARSREVELFQALYEDRPIPDGFDLMGEMIRRVRSSAIALSPRADSGWYDHQTWSLEPLLVPDRMPEGPRLGLGRRYLAHLEDLFRAGLALARETHVKGAGGGRGGYGGVRSRPIWVRPDATVEPLPSLYSRRAACFRFVREVLEDAFGPDSLRTLHRRTPDGVMSANLTEELAEVEGLFLGAAATARRELGLSPDIDAGPFAAWAGRRSTDPDLARDARMMVPVFRDFGRQQIKVWALLGWRTLVVDASFRRPPVVRAVEPERRTLGEKPDVLFDAETWVLPTPVVAEVYVSRLLDRDEFRKHCDRHKTRAAILANLPGVTPSGRRPDPPDARRRR